MWKEIYNCLTPKLQPKSEIISDNEMYEIRREHIREKTRLQNERLEEFKEKFRKDIERFHAFQKEQQDLKQLALDNDH